MKNKLLAVVAVAVVVAAGGAYVLLGGSDEWDSGYMNSVVDTEGRTVFYPDEVKRVAAIGPSALRLYCYAGDVDLIVGIENIDKEESDLWGKPYLLANKDKFLNLDTVIGEGGPNNTPEKETLISADLDVLFTTYSLTETELNKLQNSIKTSVIKLDSGIDPPFDEAIYESLRVIGDVCETESRAEASISLITGIQDEFNELTKNIPENKRVEAYIGGLSMRGQQGLTSTTPAYSLFDALNIINVYESETKQIHPIDGEKLMELNPKHIIIDEGGIENIIRDYEGNPTLIDNLSAFDNDNDKVFVIARSNWYANNIEVTLLNGYYIGSVLYPELFDDNLEDKFNEITSVLLGVEIYEEFIRGNSSEGEQRDCFKKWSEITG